MLTELFEIELHICIKMDLALNNPQRLICHKTLPASLSSATTPGPIEPGNNGNEWVLRIP